MPLLDPLMLSCNTYMSIIWEIRSFHRELVIKPVATRQTFLINLYHFSKEVHIFHVSSKTSDVEFMQPETLRKLFSPILYIYPNP